MATRAPTAEEQFNAETSRRVEAIYLAPDVSAQRDHCVKLLAPKAGERFLDIGSGPGLVSQAIGRHVGERGCVEAIDVSAPMIEIASKRCAPMPWVHVQRADADTLPFGDAEFDAASCLQVYEYVFDISRALSELARVLKPGGRAVIMDNDWESAVWASSEDPRMRRVLEAWDEHLPHPRLPRTLAGRLRAAGLRVVRAEVQSFLDIRYDENSYSAGMINVIGAFVAGHRGLTEGDVRAWRDDLLEHARRDAYFFSLNRFVFVVEK